jgi:hypothetical protein
LITAKEADRKAEIRARIIPSEYLPSTLNIIERPTTTSKPKKISYHIIFFLKNIGSIMDAKKAPVDKQAKVMDTLDTLMALKKVNQCRAITNPATKNFKITFLGNFSEVLVYLLYKKIKKTAKSMRYHTNGNASSEISLPKIAVNPQIKTIQFNFM